MGIEDDAVQEYEELVEEAVDIIKLILTKNKQPSAFRQVNEALHRVVLSKKVLQQHILLDLKMKRRRNASSGKLVIRRKPLTEIGKRIEQGMVDGLAQAHSGGNPP